MAVERTQETISAAAGQVVERADYIQPLPQVLVRLIGHLYEQEIDATQVVREISVDPVVAADLLKYANSSAIGRRQRTTKISDAVNYVGPRCAVRIAISTGVAAARGAMLDRMPPPIHRWHSSRAVLTACTAAYFAGRMEGVSEESAYIVGLLQDVGILVLACALGERYVESLQRVQRIGCLDLAHVEQDCFGATHAEVSAALLRRWRLPEFLVSLVLHHHDRDGVDRANVDRRLLRAMQIGEALSDLYDNRDPQRYWALRKLLDHYGVRRASACRACLAEAVARTGELSAIFQVPPPDNESLQAMLLELARRESVPGLPCSADETDSPPDDAVSRGATVLVIDDDPWMPAMIRHHLRDRDCRVLACETLAEGRRLAEQAQLVLCDIHLEGENGIDLVRELRSHSYRGPIVMISSDSHRATVLDSIQAGVNDYLLKPFSRTQLLEKVNKHLAV